MPATETNRLLKAHDARSLDAKVAFNYEDLRDRCDKYIEEIRLQARQILTDAQSDAERIRREAEEQGLQEGFQAGHAEGLKDQMTAIDNAATEKSTEQLQTTLPALQTATAALNDERNRWLATWQNMAIQLSVAIAEKLLHSELEKRPELVKNAVVEALELAVGNPRIQLHLNPQDVERLGSWSHEIIATMSPAGLTEIVADPQITPGGCVVETEHGTIDAQVETKLARIAQELMDDAV